MSDGKLIFDTQLDTKGFESGASKIKSLGSTLGSGIRTVAKVGATAILGLGTAIAGTGVYATKLAVDFESAFAGVRKTVDASEADFKKLEKGILDMATQIPYAAKDIASVAESAGQLGIETDNILGFTEVMLKLGDATNLTAEEAATSFARFANITDMPQTEFEKLGSTVVALGNNLATTEAEIVEMGMRLAGTGTQVGLTQAEIMGLAGALSSVGINAEAGGSAMSRVMQKINTEVLGSGKQLKNFAKVSGMSAQEFATVWKGSPQDAIIAFVEGLGDIQKSGGDVAGTLKDLGLKSIQEIDTLARLSNNTAVLTEALKLANIAWEENTALTKEAEQRYETTEMKIKLLGTSLQTLGIRIGQDMIQGLRGSVIQAQTYIDEMAEAFEQGGLRALSDKVGEIIGDIAVNIANQAPRFIESGTQLITSILEGISSRSDEVASSAVEIANSLIKGISDVSNQLIEIGSNIVISLAQGISQNSHSIGQSASSVITNFVNALLVSGSHIVEAGAKVVLSIAQGIASNADKLTQSAVNLILTLVNTLASNIDTVAKIGVDIVKGIAKGLWDSKGEIIKHIPEIITLISMAFAIGRFNSIGKSIVSQIAIGLATNTTPIAAAGGSIVSKLATSIIAKKVGLTGAAQALTTAIATGLKSSAVGTAAAGIVTTIGTTIASGAGIVAAAGAKIIAVLVAVLSNPVGLALAGAGLVLLIIKAITGKKKDVENATKDTVQGGMEQGLSKVQVEANNLVDDLVNGIKAGTISVEEAYKTLIENGVSTLQAVELFHELGVENTQGYIQGIAQDRDGVRIAFAEMRGDGLGELKALDELIDAGVLNVEAFGDGVEDGKEALFAKYRELREKQLSEADAVAELYEIQKSNVEAITEVTEDNLPKVADLFESYKNTLGSTLEAIELFKSKGLLNVEAFGMGSEEGTALITSIYEKMAQDGATTLEIFDKLYNLGLLATGESGFSGGLLEGSASVEEVYAQLAELPLTRLEINDILTTLGFSQIEAFNAGLGEASPLVDESMSEVQQKMISSLMEGKDGIGQVGLETIEQYRSKLEEGKEGVNSTTNGIKQTIEENLEFDGAAAAEKPMNDFVSGIQSKTGEVETASKSVGDAATKGAESGLKELPNKSKESVTKFNQSIKEGTGEAQSSGKELGKAPVTGAESEISKLKEVGTKGGTEFVTGVKSKSTEAQAAGKELISSVEKGIQSGQTSATNAIKKIVEQGLKDIKLNESKYNTQGSELIKQLSQGMSKTEGEIKSASNKLMQSAQSSMRTAIPQFVTIGREIANGMAQGIRSGSSAVQAAARQVANQAVKTAKASLGIHSPSKVMAEQVGKPISQGISVGIKESSNTIYDALGKINDEMLTHMAKNHEKVTIFQEKAEKERLEKIKQLNITNVDRAYQEYNTLHRTKLEELENELIRIQEEKEKLKSGKKTEARRKELDAEKQLTEEKKKILEDYSKNFEDTYKKMVEDYSKAMEEIEGKAEKLADKLTNYVEVLEVVRDAEGNVIKDDYGNDLMQLTDIKQQIAKVTEYGALLSELQRRGADTDVMARMLEMDVDKATLYGTLLLDKSKAEFEEYMNDMKILRETSQNIANQYYKKEKDELRENFVEGSIEELEKMTGKSAEIGKKSAEELAKGFKSNGNMLINEVNALTQLMESTLTSGTQQAIGNAFAAVQAAMSQIQQITQNSINITSNGQSYDISGSYGMNDIFSSSFERDLRRKGVPSW